MVGQVASALDTEVFAIDEMLVAKLKLEDAGGAGGSVITCRDCARLDQILWQYLPPIDQPADAWRRLRGVRHTSQGYNVAYFVSVLVT